MRALKEEGVTEEMKERIKTEGQVLKKEGAAVCTVEETHWVKAKHKVANITLHKTRLLNMADRLFIFFMLFFALTSGKKKVQL